MPPAAPPSHRARAPARGRRSTVAQPARRQSLPSWLGTSLKGDSPARRRQGRRRKLGVGRRGGVAILAMIAAAGVVFIRPGDLAFFWSTTAPAASAPVASAPVASALVAATPAAASIHVALTAASTP